MRRRPLVGASDPRPPVDDGQQHDGGVEDVELLYPQLVEKGCPRGARRSDSRARRREQDDHATSSAQRGTEEAARKRSEVCHSAKLGLGSAKLELESNTIQLGSRRTLGRSRHML